MVLKMAATVAILQFFAGVLVVSGEETASRGQVALSPQPGVLSSRIHEVGGRSQHWTNPALSSHPVDISKWTSFVEAKQIIVCWSSGHAGTTSLAAIFQADSESLSLNELYGFGGVRNDLPVVLPVLKKAYHSQNGTMLWEYLQEMFLPALESSAGGKKRIFLFGHNCIFGIVHALLHLAPIQVIRLRRDPCATISSFLANPPICPDYEKDERGQCVQFCPGDAGTVWKSPLLKAIWMDDNGPKFKKQLVSRCWWYLDEIEYQWQQLQTKFAEHLRGVLEVYWDNTPDFPFEEMVREIAIFSGVEMPSILLNANHHIKGKIKRKGTSSNPDAVEALREIYLSELDSALPADIVRYSVAQAACNGSMYRAYPMGYLANEMTATERKSKMDQDMMTIDIQGTMPERNVPTAFAALVDGSLLVSGVPLVFLTILSAIGLTCIFWGRRRSVNFIKRRLVTRG